MNRGPALRACRGAGRRALAALVLALLGTVVWAASADAATKVTYGTLPSGWTVDERTAEAGFERYAIYFDKEYEVEANHTYHAIAYLQEDYSNHYASLEEFKSYYYIEPRPDDTDGQYWEKTWHKYEAGTTSVGGRPAYYVTYSYDGYHVNHPVGDANRLADYWVDLGDGGGAFMRVQAVGDSWTAASDLSVSEVEALWAEAQSIFQSWQIDWGGGTTGTETTLIPSITVNPGAGTTVTSIAGSTDSGATPWRTAAGGAAAVAAAVAAILGAAAGASKDGTTKKDPDRPLGYILHVSAGNLALAPERSQPFTAEVYQVMPGGRMEPAAANVAITAPAGVGVEPAAGPSPLSSLVWPTGAIPAGSGLLVQATTAGGSHQTTVTLAGEGEPKLEVVFEPADKQQLVVGGGDQVTLVATVNMPPQMAAGLGIDPGRVRDSIAFTSASRWLDISAAVDWGAGRAVNVEASQPDPTHPKEPPPTCVVRVTAEIGATLLSEDVSIAMVNPAIDAGPDTVEFAAESGSTAEVSVWIEPPSGRWEFETAWREGSQALARVDLQATGPAACRLTLTEDSVGKLDSSRPEDSATLRVLAKAPCCPELERHIKVIVGQEGLFIDPVGRHPEDGSYHLMADGSGEPKEIGFRVYVRDAGGAVRLDDGLGQDLTFAPTDEPGSRSRNGAEVAGLTIEFAGMRGVERPAATYRAGVESPIPGDVPVLAVRFNVSVPGQTDEAKFAKSLTLGLVPSRKAPGGTDWQIEYNRCQKIINDFVPLKYQSDLQRILEKRGRHLGSDGVYELRHRIWSIAQDLTLGEGGMGYHDEAKWANRIVVVLEYAEWAGDIAFHAATTHFVGPWAALGIAQLKQLVVSAIVAYEEELTPTQWLWQNFGAIPAILEGQLIDVDKFSKLTNNNKVKAWALFVAYHFFESYLYDKKSFTDSLIEAGRQARDEAIASWLGEKLRAERDAAANRRPEVQRPKEAKGTGPTGPSAQTRARDWSQRIKDATDGGKKMPPEMVADIMRDPDAARELRRADPDSYNKYADARGEMRQTHDSELKQRLKERYGREVRIETVGTERGIDRDYHVLVEVPHPSDPSKSIWIEVPPREWAADSYRIFADQTGGPKGPDTPETRAAQAKHAMDHQQMATDVDSRQACADISDQLWVRDAEGNMVPTQHMGRDPKTGEMRPLTNLERVETGEGRLISGETTGKTFQDKVADSMKMGPDGKPQPTLDALKQAQKAGESLQGCREGYQKQGLDPGPADPKVAQGMKIVEQGADMKWPPAEVDRALRQQAGFEGGLSEYMSDVSKGFAQLDKAT